MTRRASGKDEWLHCNKCLIETRHELVAKRSRQETDEVDDGRYFIEWSICDCMMECRGCGTVLLRRRVASLDVDVDETEYFPARVARPLPR